MVYKNVFLELLIQFFSTFVKPRSQVGNMVSQGKSSQDQRDLTKAGMVSPLGISCNANLRPTLLILATELAMPSKAA